MDTNIPAFLDRRGDNVVAIGKTTNESVFGDMPDSVNFNVTTEPLSRREVGKKYVINANSDYALGVVNDTYPVTSHATMFSELQTMLREHMPAHDLNNIKVKYKTARHGAWALMDITFDDLRYPIATSRHKTDITMRGIFWHGIDGLTSNNGVFGAIDMFCTNGMISGEYSKVRMKNSKNFNLDNFVDEVREAKDKFYLEAQRLQRMAETEITLEQGEQVIEAIVGADRKVEKMKELFRAEVSTRGSNVFALHSAFTNYASYADERNGFNLRNTGKDCCLQRNR